MKFTDTPKKINWNGEFKRDIFHDLDGTLIGDDAEHWMTRYYPHLATDKCVKSEDTDSFGGPIVVCEADTKLVKFNLYDVKPSVL